MSVVIVGCQTAAINDRLKSDLIKKVNEICQESLQLRGVLITIKFVSNQTLKKDIPELRCHLHDTASAMRLSFG